MDYTWTQQIAGKRAVYVTKAVAYAADPHDYTYLRKQVWRWMSGFFQNVRIHGRQLRRKPMLALWIALAVWDIMMAPAWWAAPVIMPLLFHFSMINMFIWWIGLEMAVTVPVIIVGAVKRKTGIIRALINLPFVYGNKAVNTWYAWKAMVVELILVPLGKSKGLVVYEKGR